MKAGQAKVAVNLRFDVETYKKLEEAARALNITVSAFVNKVTLAYLNIKKEV